MRIPLEDHVRGHRPCPRCGDEMWIVERRGQKLDTCARCQGLWFDSSELDAVLGGDTRVELMVLIKPSIRGERLVCPSCSSRMDSKEIFGVFVDQCPECSGIWLDKGETEKIWSITDGILHPYKHDEGDMGPAKFWYPFKLNQDSLTG